MAKMSRWLLSMGIVGLLALSSGCDREGPAERAGEKVDEAIDETGEKIEEAGDRMEDAAR